MKKLFSDFSNLNNSNKLLITTFIAFLVILFTSLSASYIGYASASSFSVSSNISTNTVCPSSTIVIEETVSSSSAGAFTITNSGSASSFTTTVPTGFWLDADQVQSIYSYITPSSKIAPGKYTLEITIDKDGEIKTVEHEIIVENCHSTSVNVEPETQKICSCEKKTIALNISNNGNYLENYKINVEGPAAKWVNLSSDTLTIDRHSSKTIEAYVYTPCDVEGNYEINFVVKSDSPYAQATKTSSINVVQCYDYTLNTEKTYYKICEAEELGIPVTIKNLGTKNNNYNINLYAPDWANIDKKTLAVNEGQENNFNVIVNPPYQTEGNFTINLEALSKLGNVIKKHTLSLNVKKCYNVGLTIEEEKDKICNALSKTYSVVVKNTGEFKNSYDLLLEGPEWVTLSEKHVVLNASEEKAITLDIHPPYSILPGNYSIIVKAEDKVSGAKTEDKIKIETVSVEDCYKPAISTKQETIEVGRDNTATVLFIIENKGSKDANYNIEISGTGTSFSQINPSAIDVKAQKAKTVYLYLAPPPETKLQDYKITVTVRLADSTIIASKTITVKVTKTKEEVKEVNVEENKTETGEVTEKEKGESLWSKIARWFKNLFKPKTEATKTEANQTINQTTNITTNETTNQTAVNETENASNATNETANETNVTTNQTTTNKTTTNQTANETNQTTSGITGGAITNETANETNVTTNQTANETNQTTTNQTTNETTNQTVNHAPILEKEIPDLNAESGKTLVVNLNDYFSDPDNDNLTFVTIKPLNIDVSVNGYIVKLIPQANFTGKRTITFYASDGKELTESNKVNIIVEEAQTQQATATAENQTNQTAEGNETQNETQNKEQNKPFIDISKNKNWIITGIIILVIVIILFSGLGKKMLSFFEEEVEVNNNHNKKNNKKK